MRSLGALLACAVVLGLGSSGTFASARLISSGTATNSRQARGTPDGARLPRPATIVSLEFDHAFSDQLPAVQLAASYGMHVTVFAMSGRIGTSGYMSAGQLRNLQAAGNEIGGHTIDHPDLSMLAPAAQRHEICDDRTALQADGLDVTDFAYPYGHLNGATPGIVRSCGYESARGTGGIVSHGGCYGDCPTAETIPPAAPLQTRTVNSILRSTSLSTIEGYVARAEATGGGWLQIVFHYVCDGCDLYSVSEPTLAEFLAWLAPRSAIGTRVETVSQVIHTPFAPGPIWLTSRGRAGVLSTPRRRSRLRVGAGASVDVVTDTPATGIALYVKRLGNHGRRIAIRIAAAPVGPTNLHWTLPLPRSLAPGTGTLWVTYGPGRAGYRLAIRTLPGRLGSGVQKAR